MRGDGKRKEVDTPCITCPMKNGSWVGTGSVVMGLVNNTIKDFCNDPINLLTGYCLRLLR